MNKYLNIALIFIILNIPSALAENKAWYYGVGTLQDEIFTKKIFFMLPDGSGIAPFSVGADRSYILGKPLESSYFFSYKGGQQMHTPLPIKMYVEWVSYVDKKRYGVTISLPKNLEELNKDCDDGFTLATGTAPNGYYEVFSLDVCKRNNVLITRGIAPEVITAYDKEEPLANQFEQSWAEFDKYYTPLIKKYPIPYWRFSLDQPPIVSTYPNNVWGNRKPSKEWLARMEAEKQANAPAPPPQNRCWANKKPEPTKTIQLDKSSPQFYFQRTLWEYAPDLLQQVYKVGNDVDAVIVEAWDEAKQKGLSDDDTEAWVLARLVTLSNYPIETIKTQLKISPENISTVKHYIAEMCQ